MAKDSYKLGTTRVTFSDTLHQLITGTRRAAANEGGANVDALPGDRLDLTTGPVQTGLDGIRVRIRNDGTRGIVEWLDDDTVKASMYYDVAGEILKIDGEFGSGSPYFPSVPIVDVDNWAAVTFAHSWDDYDNTTYRAAKYKRDATGTVHLRGCISAGTLSQSAFTLPIGLRPAKRLVFPVCSNNAFGRVDVFPDGTVVPYSPSSNAWVSLECIKFDTLI